MVLESHENSLIEEIKQKSEKIRDNEKSLELVKNDEIGRLDTSIENYKENKENLEKRRRSAVLLIKVFLFFKIRNLNRKLLYLTDNYDLLINKSIRDIKKEIYHDSKSLTYLSENKQKVIYERSKPEINELEHAKKSIYELRTLIAGAVGESLVEKEIEKLEPRVYVPKVFLKLAVEVVRALRGDERLEIGPRTSINAGLVGRSSALLEGLSVAGFCNVKEGIYTAILGKALYEDKAGVEKRIDEVFPEISSYIEKNIKEIDISKIVRYCHEEWGNDKEWDSTNIKKLINGKKAPDNFVKLFRWTLKNESIDKNSIYEVMSDYLLAYDRGCEISEKTN